MRLASIAPIRVVLALALLAAALAGDAPARSVLLAFLVGTFVLAFGALADRRGLLLRAREVEPRPLPADAVREPVWRAAAAAAWPSTVGVTGLTITALAVGNEVLAAVLAGAAGGLGLAAAGWLLRVLAWEREQGIRVYVDRRGRRFVSAAGTPAPR